MKFPRLAVASVPFSLAVFGFTSGAESQGNAERATRAAKFCAEHNQTKTIEEFAYCTAAYVTRDELKQCATSKICFGISIQDIVTHGGCGGANSVARQIFGSDICGDACTGGISKVVYYNSTNKDIRPRVKGQCDSREDRGTVKPNMGMEWKDRGEGHYWVWSGGVTNPKRNCNGQYALNFTDVGNGKYRESPPEGKWKLLTGHVYEFRNVNGCVVPFDITSKYLER